MSRFWSPLLMSWFASPILQDLYQMDSKTFNDKPTIDEEFPEVLKKALLIIDELMKNQSCKIFQLLSSKYNVLNESILPAELIKEILEWTYNFDKELHILDTKYFYVPILDKLSFIPSYVVPIEIFNAWLLIILYASIMIPWIIDYMFNSNLSDFNKFDSAIIFYMQKLMKIQYFITILHLLLCQFAFCVNAMMPLNTFMRWRKYFQMFNKTIHLLLHTEESQETNASTTSIENIGVDGDALWLFFVPYQKLLHNNATAPISKDNNAEFKWFQFATAYITYTFKLYSYNRCALVCDRFIDPKLDDIMFLRWTIVYELFTALLYIVPLMCTIFIFAKNNIKQMVFFGWNILNTPMIFFIFYYASIELGMTVCWVSIQSVMYATLAVVYTMDLGANLPASYTYKDVFYLVVTDIMPCVFGICMV